MAPNESFLFAHKPSSTQGSHTPRGERRSLSLSSNPPKHLHSRLGVQGLPMYTTEGRLRYSYSLLIPEFAVSAHQTFHLITIHLTPAATSYIHTPTHIRRIATATHFYPANLPTAALTPSIIHRASQAHNISTLTQLHRHSITPISYIPFNQLPYHSAVLQGSTTS